MSRFYVRPEDVKGDEILVSKEEAHHIVDVMRLSSGDEVVAFDGEGREYIGKILNVSKGALKIKIEKINEVKPEQKTHITLAQALPKRAKMDFIIEKATELGADAVIPLITERTIVNLSKEKASQKAKHWQNIGISASKQCGRVSVPQVGAVLKFNELLTEIKSYDLVMMACLAEGTKPIKEMIAGFKGKKILAMVGPEGDFSPKEIGSAKAQGARLISLGHSVLRVDTAAIFILSILNYESNI